jgi:hypothetical protein
MAANFTISFSNSRDRIFAFFRTSGERKQKQIIPDDLSNIIYDYIVISPCKKFFAFIGLLHGCPGKHVGAPWFGL